MGGIKQMERKEVAGKPLLSVQFKKFYEQGFRALCTTRHFGNCSPLSSKTLFNDLQRLILPMQRRILMPREVCGNSISFIEKELTFSGVIFDSACESMGVDGLLTNHPWNALAIYSSDCIPLVLGSTIDNTCGVIHVSREALINGILEFLRTLLDIHGYKMSDFIFGVGPSICANCYVFKEEKFEKEILPRLDGFLKEFVWHDDLDGLYHFDMRRAVVEYLMDAGVKPENIEKLKDASGLPYCTYCNNDLFFSRRQGDKGQNFATLITSLQYKIFKV